VVVLASLRPAPFLLARALAARDAAEVVDGAPSGDGASGDRVGLRLGATAMILTQLWAGDHRYGCKVRPGDGRIEPRPRQPDDETVASRTPTGLPSATPRAGQLVAASARAAGRRSTPAANTKTGRASAFETGCRR